MTIQEIDKEIIRLSKDKATDSKTMNLIYCLYQEVKFYTSELPVSEHKKRSK